MRNVSIGVKLIGGFIGVAVITLVVGFVGWMGAGQIDQHMDDLGHNQLPSMMELLKIQDKFTEIEKGIESLLNPALTLDQRKKTHDAIAKAREDYAKAYKAFEALPMTEEVGRQWKEFVGSVSEWKEANDQFFQASHDMEATGITNPISLLGRFNGFKFDHYQLVAEIQKMIHAQKVYEGGEDATKCAFGRWLASFETESVRIKEALGDVITRHRMFHQSVVKIKQKIKEGALEEARGLYLQDLLPAVEEAVGHLGHLVKEAEGATALYEKMNQQATGPCLRKATEAMARLEKLVESNTREANQAAALGDAVVVRTKLFTLSGMAVGFLAALALGVTLTLTISRPLRRVIDGLSDSSDQVASASSQVSSSSQQLAEGASEQAAALEETSSSMEEMSSMTRQNAENASQADNLMREANHAASQAKESMANLTASMSDISRASEETQKIIKTIDEIAFQTNLLALNAAVEAARAGEAGAGFAVVADEVRNLAMRAAEAAKNTATLIEGTVKRIGEGSQLVQKTNEEFNTVARSMDKVGELVGEIAAASQEQAQGIDQVSRAITEMDKVVQQNASGAEESASASEEMNAQAEQMKTFVGDLENLVGGKKARGVASPAIQPEKLGLKGVLAKKPRFNKGAAIDSPRLKSNGNGKALRAFEAASKNARVEQLIPMREENLSDF